MPLSPEQEWTLVACGLVAHADGIIGIGEWDRVLVLLDDRIDSDEAATWLLLLADQDALRERLEALQPPAPLFSEDILERAWRMALADGSGSDGEAAVLDTVAAKLGVSSGEVATLRGQWLAQAQIRSEIVAGFAVVMACLDGEVAAKEIEEYEALLERLPLREGRRDVLRALLDTPPDLDTLVGQMLVQTPEERGVTLQSIVPLVRAGSGEGAERALFVDVAARLAITQHDAETMLCR